MSEPSLFQRVFILQAQLSEGVMVEEKLIRNILKGSKELNLGQLKSLDGMLNSQKEIHGEENIAVHERLKKHFRGMVEQQELGKLENSKIEEKPFESRIDIGQFLMHSHSSNNKKVGLCLLDENGGFVLFDELAKEIFELSHQKLKSVTIFEMILPASMNRIRAYHGARIMGLHQHSKNQVRFSIYSESNRKKSLKQLGRFKKQYYDLDSSARKKALKSESKVDQVKNSTEASELYCKYLKCITMNIQRVQVNFCRYLRSIKYKRTAIQSLEEVNFHLNMNHISLKEVVYLDDNADVTFQAALCEVKEADNFEHYNYNDLLADQQIQKFEDRFTRKLRKLSKEVRNMENIA